MRPQKLIRALAIGVAITYLSPASTEAQHDIELVQSVPAETNLAHPALPFARETWIRMVREAKTSIDLAQFYLSSPNPQGPLEAVIAEMELAAARGVKIRVLISDKLAEQDPLTLERFRKMKNTSVRIYNLTPITGGIIHAKFWIVDGEDIFVGSQNFDWRALEHIHETGIRLKSRSVARQLTRIFEVDWETSLTGKIPDEAWMEAHATDTGEARPEGIELVASPPSLNPRGIRPALDALLELLQSAKKKIRVQLLNYSPVSGGSEYWSALDNALRAAAVRGVQVQLMVSDWNTAQPGIDHLKSLGQIPNLEVRIVTIPAFSGGFIPYSRVIHSKLMVVDDDVLWVGNSNWSRGYFRDSRNVELLIRRPGLAVQGQQIFDRLWSSGYAEKVDPTRTYAPPRRE